MDLFDFVYIGAMLIFFVGLWFFYRAACRTDRNLNDELPYKVDAPKTESKSQKRKYTKRSKYWNTGRR
jgi:uncharacterized membrane protein